MKNFGNVFHILKRGMVPELVSFIGSILTLPHSNIYSNETLTGILHSKRLINKEGKLCFDYDIPKDVIKKHNFHMYNTNQ